MISKHPQTEQKQYERLDRHVRTSATILELLHWDEVRVATRLSRSHHLALRKEIDERLRKLTEVTTCAER